MLFLFSEVGPADAPTRIRVGSPTQAVPATENRPVVTATGTIGDVHLCHPFLVHAAQPHRGRTPRFMAQPPLYATQPLDLEAPDPTPVARAVQIGLAAGRG
jgi:hypothetical protein